ncbi:MAG: hypothetical protein ACI4ED_02895 [Suilimivivens sp.]
MDKKEFKKRGKGLLALLLAMIMMFGSSLTVFAQEYVLLGDDSLTEGQPLEGGDKISVYASGNSLEVLIDDQSQQIGEENGYYYFELPADKSYRVESFSKDERTDSSDKIYRVSLQSINSSDTVNKVGSSSPHTHNFEWVETIEPTETSDGLMEHKCACGAVDDSYVIPGSMAFVKNIVKMIQEAPGNGTVEITTGNYTCYTAYIINELIKRPDVSLKTTYKDKDGNVKSFTIPAGQAPTDGAQFYGFTYLGNLYGWN